MSDCGSGVRGSNPQCDPFFLSFEFRNAITDVVAYCCETEWLLMAQWWNWRDTRDFDQIYCYLKYLFLSYLNFYLEVAFILVYLLVLKIKNMSRRKWTDD